MDRFELAGTRAALLTLMISSTALAQVPTQPGVVGRPVAGVAAGPAAPGATARPAPPIRSAAGVLALSGAARSSRGSPARPRACPGSSPCDAR